MISLNINKGDLLWFNNVEMHGNLVEGNKYIQIIKYVGPGIVKEVFAYNNCFKVKPLNNVGVGEIIYKIIDGEGLVYDQHNTKGERYCFLVDKRQVKNLNKMIKRI